MSTPLLVIGEVVIWMMVLHAVISGKVMAGSRGTKAIYYDRKEQPFLYCFFLGVYLLAGLFLLLHTV